MTVVRPVRPTRVFMGRLSRGDDLLDALTGVCAAHDVRAGRVEAIGAVERATVAFYDQETREYRSLALPQPLEITKLAGNVSLKDGKPFVHAHVTLADRAGRAFGGHLLPGTAVFACEFVLEAFDGAEFVRAPDAETGLTLWRVD